MNNEFYTIDKVAEILGMHHKTIRKFITEGKLGANKIGKQWRISGHDLSVFIEKNNVNINEKSNEKNNEELNVDFTRDGENLNPINNKINVSTVVDISDVDMDDYSRISNTLIAIMNCKDSELEKSTMNMKYNDKEERLRVILWGSINFIKDMVDSIEIIVKQNDL